MELTLKWWTDLKNHNDNKVNGQAAPETEFEKKLKAYDALRKAIDSTTSLNKAIAGLTEVENSRRASFAALKTGFPKLSLKVEPNYRVLNTLISDEKKMLEAKGKEVAAKMALGGPQMQGVGPGANLRKKNFDQMIDKVKQLNAAVRKLPTLEKARLDDYVKYLDNISKDVKLYCDGRKDTLVFKKDYDDTISGIKKVKSKFGKKESIEEWKNVGVRLARMATHDYVK